MTPTPDKPVVAVTIRFTTPCDRATGAGLTLDRGWIEGLTRAVLSGISVWCDGANAYTEPTVTVEEEA